MRCLNLFLLCSLIALYGACLGRSRKNKTLVPTGPYVLIALIENTDTLLTTSRKTSFQIKNNQLSTSVGCNQIGGQWHQTGKQLKISQLMATEMYCEDSTRLEERYLAALTQVDSIKQTKDHMYLKGQQKVVLIFQKIRNQLPR